MQKVTISRVYYLDDDTAKKWMAYKDNLQQLEVDNAMEYKEIVIKSEDANKKQKNRSKRNEWFRSIKL
jgi:hypothetical protein